MNNVKISEIEHGYEFTTALTEVVPEDFEITEYEDFSGVAEERSFEEERKQKYEKQTWNLDPSADFPDGEEVWIADGVIGLHYLASTDPSDQEDITYMVKNQSKKPVESDIHAPGAEAVSKLAGLVQDDLGFAYPETVNLPYTENDKETSEVIRFVPNIAYGEDHREMSNDPEWREKTKQSLHDLYVFNYFVGGAGDDTHNFAYTPGGSVIPHDYHPRIGFNSAEEQSRNQPLIVDNVDRYLSHPEIHEPSKCGIEKWELDRFDRAVDEIQGVDDSRIREEIEDLSESESIDVDGLLSVKEGIDEIFSRDVLWN